MSLSILSIIAKIAFYSFILWFILNWITKDDAHDPKEIALWNAITVLIGALLRLFLFINVSQAVLAGLAVLTLIAVYTLWYFVLGWRFYVEKPMDRLKILGLFILVKGAFNVIWGLFT